MDSGSTGFWRRHGWTIALLLSAFGLAFAVRTVDLDGAPLRLFGRIEGRPWSALAIGQTVDVEPYEVADGRVFYRFRARGP